MRKIISLFQRNYDTDHLVRNEVVPGAEWVINGEGIATRKFDGTCCMMRSGNLYKRYILKPGKTSPPGFEFAQDADLMTKEIPGWVPVGMGPEDQYFRAAYDPYMMDGTYELCGPKIQGNPEGFHVHCLIRHGIERINAPRTFESIKSYLSVCNIEGVVWHHPDGRMVKIKGRDFGLKRKCL